MTRGDDYLTNSGSALNRTVVREEMSLNWSRNPERSQPEPNQQFKFPREPRSGPAIRRVTVFALTPMRVNMDVEDFGELGPNRRGALLDREHSLEQIRPEVDEILGAVREEGDVALRRYAREFDEMTVGNLEVTGDLERAYDRIDPEIRTALEEAAQNVESFHERQVPEDWRESFDGRELGRQFRPIDRVGAYVPGGRASYPSSAIMTVVPARVAGVNSIVVTTPPGDPIPDVTLAALYVAGADAVYQAGGAQAIGALAYGTESIPPVQKIVGPGNRWVTAAKVAVQGDVAIDFPAGPSEILILADETASPEYLATDLIAQAEHGKFSPSILLSPSAGIAEETVLEIERLIQDTSRSDVIQSALDQPTSGIFQVRSMSEAIGFANEYAPEHLSIQTNDPESVLDRIESAGSIFLGHYSPVAAGDYASGTNHVLPTGGRARVASGLSVDTFLRSRTVQRLTDESLASVAGTITCLAELEGLDAHARSITVRTREE